MAKTYLARSQSDSAQDGDLDSAIAYSSVILSVEKENTTALNYKGLAFFLQDNNDSALVYLKKFVEKSKNTEIIERFIDEYVKQGKKASELNNLNIENFNLESR